MLWSGQIGLGGMARPGELDQLITLQAEHRTSDGIGGSTVAYADLATDPTVWASVLPVRGRENTEEGRTNAEGLYLFTIRNRADIDETHRIVWESEAYDIRAVKRVSSREMYLKIEAERGI